NALLVAGPSAIYAWIIGAVAITILALLHAELGAMYPVSGGTARFPHFAFGGSAGASYGWFSWLQAVTVAPVEVIATISYISNFSAANGFAPAGIKGVFSALATGGVIFALLGFEQADQLAGESRRPKRDIPLGIIGSIVLGSIIYLLLQVAYIGALPHSLIPG